MSKSEDGGEEFPGVRVMCYDSAGWVRKNFKAKVDAHNEASSFPPERSDRRSAETARPLR